MSLRLLDTGQPTRLRHRVLAVLILSFAAGLGGLWLFSESRIEASPQALELRELRDTAMLMALGGAALILAVVYAYLLHALKSLVRLVSFSRQMGQRAGAQWTEESCSREFLTLGRALNQASSALATQMAELRATEGRTSAIINAAPDALVGLDEAGRITLVNHAVTSVLGCTEDQIMGQGIAQILPQWDAVALDQATLQGAYMRASDSHLNRIETVAQRQDGTVFPAEVSISRVNTEQGKRYACVLRDLTEHRMTLGMMELYNRALECATNGIVISDMSLPGQPVFYANPAFSRITGYQPWEVMGRNCAMLQGDDKAQPELEVLRDAIARRESATVVLRNYRKDGALFFNELAIAPVRTERGDVKHYVGILNDVSDRERSRMDLAERTARLNAVFDLSPDGYAVFDRDGVLVYGNAALRRMTGWGISAGLTLAEFDDALSQQCDPSKPYPRLPTQGHGEHECDDMVELLHPQRRTLSRLARLNIDERGESILYFRDVTREMEVDRMKSEFLSTAAHELRTPMVSVFGFTELLLNRPVSEAKRRDVLETIHRQASLLINMVNELLDLARIESRQGKELERCPTLLGPLLQQAADSVLIHGDARRVQMQVAHGDQTLMLDPEKTHRALINVISNAFKYSPQGGDILLRTLDGELKGEPALGIQVVDHGLGMTPEQVARVFERFFRADPSGNIPGTGLGMALVKEIVELQHGRVEVTSSPGVGTQVTLWFPAVSSSPSNTPHEAVTA